MRFYAEAFAIPDEHNQEQDRAADRLRMGELYRKLKGSEAGLGDLILQAYDRTSRTLERTPGQDRAPRPERSGSRTPWISR